MATDQEIRDRGIKFLPKQKYLQSPYQFNEPVADSVAPVPGGITNTNAFTGSGGDNFSVYNPDPNSIVNRNYQPNYDYRKSVDYNPELSDLQNQKIMQGTANFKGYDYYNKPPVNSKLQGLMSMIPYAGAFTKGVKFLGDQISPYLPVNRRAIMENELGGQGIMVNDIGQIVQGQGDYNTAENIMAGYNANKITQKTIDKRKATINESLGKFDKYDKSSPKFDQDKYNQMQDKLAALDEFGNTLDSTNTKTDKIFDFEEEEKKKDKKNTVINRFITKKKETKAAADAQAAADAADETSVGSYPTGGSYNASGGVTDSNYNQAANIAGGGGGNTATYGGQTAREATYDGNPNTGTAQGYSQHYADGGRAGYFFGGRVNYKIGGVVHPDGRKGFFKGAQADTSKGESMSPGTDASGGFRGGDNDGDNSNNVVSTVDINKKINKKLTSMIPDRVDKNQLLFDNAKRYQTLSKNRNSPFFMNRSSGPKVINKNLYTNNLTDLNLQYPDIKIKNEYGMIDGDKAKSLIDQAVLEQTISPVEGLNLTRSIDTTGTQSNTSGDYTTGNFNFSSPNIEEGILNSGVNYDLGDLNLSANLNTNDSTINDSKLGFNYGDGALTGSTFRDNDYGYTTNKLGVDKTFDVGNNFKVGLDGNYENTIYNGENYRDSEFTPSLNYNDGTFNARLSKEIVEGGTQPNLGIGFQKNGFYANANNLLSQDRTGTIGYQKNIGSPDGPLQFSAGGEMDPFTGQKTAGLYGKYTFKNGGLAGLL